MVITGTRTGLGRLLAEQFAAGGFRVVGCSRGAFDGDIPNYEHVRANVADEQSVKALFARARECGRVVALVNNAGTASANHALLTPVSVARELLETTFIGTFLCCREAARAMRRDGGSIVNLSSVHVPLATVGTSLYGSAKSAVEQFTRVFAKEVASSGIRVNCVGLPFVAGTGMVEALSPASIEAVGARLAVPEIGIVDVMHVLAPLLARDNEPPALTGQTIHLGGV